MKLKVTPHVYTAGLVVMGSYFVAPLKHAYTLSYAYESQYGIGWKDWLFVGFLVQCLFLLRGLLMAWLPNLKKNRLRFKEQVYMGLLHSASFALGWYLAMDASWYGDKKYFFLHYPHKYVSGLFKVYYLGNISFWTHNIVALLIEKKRKDFLQMLVHHIATWCLLAVSWFFYLHRAGHAILVLFDAADVLLSWAKTFHYLKWTRLCDATFLAFVVVWAYTRHWLFPQYILHVSRFREFSPYPCRPERGEHYCEALDNGVVGFLWLIEILSIYWFVSIVKLLIKVAKGENAEDTRSDSEEEVKDE